VCPKHPAPRTQPLPAMASTHSSTQQPTRKDFAPHTLLAGGSHPKGPSDSSSPAEPAPMSRVGQRMNQQELQLIIRHQAMQLQINDPVSCHCFLSCACLDDPAFSTSQIACNRW
jgi:hypothetical protein